MKLVLQRVDAAVGRHYPEDRTPDEDGPVVEIGEGLVVYVGFERDDSEGSVDKAARKVATLRIFEDGDRMFGRSLADVGGEALVLFQMPMAADLSRGRRPNFSRAASKEAARALFDRFVARLTAEGVPVVTGPFADHLELVVTNRGPFTVPYVV